MLDVLDQELEKCGHRFVRYADDCNIYVRSQRAGERVMTSIEQFLAKRLKLITLLEDNVRTITGDPARVQQVVWNLVNNAVKFTPEGGTIEVFLRDVDDHATIIVKDSGQGIAPDLLPHLFERFRQGDVKAWGANRGLGLGLAIVKHNIELYAGKVRVESELGKGARFILTFPAKTVMNLV